MDDLFKGTEPHGRSLAIGMMLTGLLALLRDKGTITNAEIRSILDDADSVLAIRANEAPARGARQIFETVARQFREPGV